MASTTVGVLFSVLLTNKCTLGKGGPTSKDCWRAVRMLCVDDCCCGRRSQSDDGARAPLLGGTHSHAHAQDSSAQSVSINSVDGAAGNNAQQDMSRSRRVSDASAGSESIENESVSADKRLQENSVALAEELRLKTRECEALRLRVMELQRQLGRQQQEQPKPSSAAAQVGSE